MTGVSGAACDRIDCVHLSTSDTVLTEGASTGEKLLFREQILEASKFVGSSFSGPGNEDSH